MRSLASDNNSGVHPLVMDAIFKANQGHALGYGDDTWTAEAVQKIKEVFTPDCTPLMTLNGTGSNTVALNIITRPFNSIICSDAAHIYVDECGSPVKSTGCQIHPIATPDGKLTPQLISHYLHGFNDQHHSQPGAIYISQCTELGTVYTPEEIKSITTLAHKYGLYVHMDGARLANAAAALNLSMKDLTADCGIDVLSLGGTKNGLMMGECVIIFNSELAGNAKYYRKQSAQLLSKMRYLSVQFTAYFTDNLWLKNATHANNMAKQLYDKIKNVPEIHFTQKVETNALFLTMPRMVIDKLHKDWNFYFWNEENNEIRLVTSFDTTEEDVNKFVESVKKAGNK